MKTIERRHFLAGLAGVVGLLATRSANAQEELPNGLGERIEYFADSVQNFRPDRDLRLVFNLSEGQILVVSSQRVGVGGNVYDADSTNHPENGQVVVIGATTNAGIQLDVFQGRHVWLTMEKSKSSSHPDRITDFDRAGKVQVTRAQIPGNCTERGCLNTRLVVMNVHNDNDGVQRFDLVEDRWFTK